MSIYRNILAAIAALSIAAPAFAEDAATTQTPADQTPAVQAADGAQQPAEEGKVSLNKASAKDLMKVKGLNASKARSIVAYRKKHGEFKSVDELAEVKGFKKMKPEALKEITDQLSI